MNHSLNSSTLEGPDVLYAASVTALLLVPPINIYTLLLIVRGGLETITSEVYCLKQSESQPRSSPSSQCPLKQGTEPALKPSSLKPTATFPVVKSGSPAESSDPLPAPSSAFNTIQRHLLIQKLHHLNTPPILIHLLHNFLSDRRQAVRNTLELSPASFLNHEPQSKFLNIRSESREDGHSGSRWITSDSNTLQLPKELDTGCLKLQLKMLQCHRGVSVHHGERWGIDIEKASE
ncbi:unnamed protein product [Gadus morhua 'NCC']